MDVLAYLGFAALALAAVLLAHYVKKVQDNADRRYPESTDDGMRGSGMV